MRLLYFTILFCLFSNSNPENRIICVEDAVLDAVLYSSCYYLNEEDNTFRFNYSDCTGETIGYGKYLETRKKIKFQFEKRNRYILETQKLKEIPDGTVKIQVRDIETDNTFFLKISVLYNGIEMEPNINGLIELEYKKGEISIYQDVYGKLRVLEINPKEDNSNFYDLRIHNPETSIIQGDTEIILRERKNQYIEKSKPKRIYSNKTRNKR